jgi:hypothetical protein
MATTDAYGEQSSNRFTDGMARQDGDSPRHFYLYANGHLVAEAKTDSTLTLKKPSLEGGSPVTDPNAGETSTSTVGWTLTLQAGDVVTDPASGALGNWWVARVRRTSISRMLKNVIFFSLLGSVLLR